MGKGDKKSRRGKIINKSYGVLPRKESAPAIMKPVTAPSPVPEEKAKPAKTTKPRVPKKKTE